MKKLISLTGLVFVALISSVGFAQADPKAVVEDHPDRPKLKFLDASGNVKKSIELIAPRNSEIKRIRKNTMLVEQSRSREAYISKNGQGVVVVDDLIEHMVPVTEQQNIAVGDTDADFLGSTTVLRYHDVNGNLLWERILPFTMGLSNMTLLMSYDGEVVAYVQEGSTSYPMDMDEDELITRLIVVSKSGKELIKVPVKRNVDMYVSGADLYMSPNGRYVAVDGAVIGGGGKLITIFFNTRTGKHWFAEKRFTIYSITNDGVLNADYRGVITGEIPIDLKPHLGE